MIKPLPSYSPDEGLLPVLPLRDVVVYPHLVIPLFVGRTKSVKALERKTGARGLRSILEHALLEIMYELPSLKNLSKVVIDEGVIRGDTPAILIFADTPAEEAVG